MIKTDLVSSVAQQTGHNVKTVAEIIESTLETIRQCLSDKDPVVIRGFGTFQVKHRAEKKARDISKGTEIVIPAKDVPTFKASKQFFNN